MAEPDIEPKAPESSGGGGGGGLKKVMGKKLGPLPVVVWIGIAIVIYLYVSKKNKGSGGGQQTDPAGNVGQINPNSGYVYGSAEDAAALGATPSGLGSSTEPGSTGGSTVGGQYADNQAWAVAAINYLVSIGVDATSANTAITTFLASQTLTTQQQAEVNLAIQRLGAPPSPPEPGGSTPPVVTPPNKTTYAANPPTGLTTTSVGSTAIGFKWNATTNASNYALYWGTTPSVRDGRAVVVAATGTAVNLKPNTLYYFRVQANPVKPGGGAPYASMTVRTAKPAPTPAPPKTVPHKPGRPPVKTPGK